MAEAICLPCGRADQKVGLDDELGAAGVRLRKCLWQKTTDTTRDCTGAAGVFLCSAGCSGNMFLPDCICGPCAALSCENYRQDVMLGNACCSDEVSTSNCCLSEIDGDARHDRTPTPQIRLCRCRGVKRLRLSDIPGPGGDVP